MSRVAGAVTNLILYDPIFGAYTELYAGLSAEITEEQNASFGKLTTKRVCNMNTRLIIPSQSLHGAGLSRSGTIYGHPS